jgi:TrmH family RNA methyltransferase
MGSIARVNVVYTDLAELIDRLPEDTPIYGTLLDGENIYEQTLSTHGLIIMGNEGNGISPAIRKKITHKLLIPNFNTNPKGADSLNVAIATAITLSEIKGHQPIEQSYNTNN